MIAIRRTVVHFVILVVIGGFISFYSEPSLGFSLFGNKDKLSTIETLYLAAEKNEQPQQRIEQWQTILKRIKGGDIVPIGSGISEKIISQNIVQDYFLNNQFENAIEFAQNNLGITDYPWALSAQLENLISTKESNIEQATTLFYAIQDSLERISNNTDKERLYYALSLQATAINNDTAFFAPNEAIQALGFVKNITNPKHRIHAMKRIAAYHAITPIIHAPEYQELYTLLNKENVQSENLIALHEKFMKQDAFNAALDALLAIQNDKTRRDELSKRFESEFDSSNYSRALRIAQATSNATKRVNMFSRMATHYYLNGYTAQGDTALAIAKASINDIKKQESQNNASQLIHDRMEKLQEQLKQQSDTHPERKIREQSIALLVNEGIEKATAFARTIKDAKYRAKTFRLLAEKQLHTIDFYNAFNKRSNSDDYLLFHPNYDTKNKIVKETIDKLENQIDSKKSQDSNDVVLLPAPTSEIGNKIPNFVSTVNMDENSDTIKQTTPYINGANVHVVHYEDSIYNFKFHQIYGNASFTEKQKTSAPQIIVIENGTIDMPAIYDELVAQGIRDVLIKTKNTYLSRLPIIVGKDAALVISQNSGTTELRLSQDSGAYLVNANTLYISDTKISGWSETNNQPTWATYKDKHTFRPYITGWSNSNTFIGGSELIAMGYNNGKSYGLTLSSGPRQVLFMDKTLLKRPRALITDNSFNNFYYGFYSYEFESNMNDAGGIRLIGNEYINGVVYGIDPHDRSKNITIALNTAYGSQKKHGIIISREVDDSFIIGNLSFDNKGTGIMIDRQSINTIIYGNTTFNNKQDGITVFESDCNLIASNRVFNNDKAGIRTRNSYDIGIFYNDIKQNQQVGITAYSANLNESIEQKKRDFALDPFRMTTTSNTIVGNTISDNGTGIFTDRVNTLFIRDNKFIDQSPKVIRGNWFEQNPDVLFRYNTGVIMVSSCPFYDGHAEFHTCKLREQGIFSGDGQERLVQRLKASACISESEKDKEQ